MRKLLAICAVAALAAGCGAQKPVVRPSPPVVLAPRPVVLPPCPKARPRTATLQVATSRFVGPGAVRLRLCRYPIFNFGPKTMQLAGHRTILDRATIASLTRAFNELREPRKGLYNCPNDNGEEMLLLFGYPSGGRERVVVELSGCRFATNGRSSRRMTVSLRRRLLFLAKHP